MGERKGVNKYYPPDFDYKKHGSLDRYHNSHPLRERAAKLSEGILIIRFEMPYNIWCNGCNKHIGMGVRYNAEKRKVGNYYSTIIYKFRMKCHLCDQYMEIQTDPANCDYKILSGARRKEERWDAKANEQIEMTDHAVKKKLMSDPMFKLEHGKSDESKLKKSLPTLNDIQSIQMEKKDDYLMNKALRKIFRDEKKRLEDIQKSDKSLLTKSSLNIKLLPEAIEDKKLAELYKYQSVVEKSKKSARDVILHQPVLTPTKSPASSKLSISKTMKRCPAISWDTTNAKRCKIDGLKTGLQSISGVKICKKGGNSSNFANKLSSNLQVDVHTDKEATNNTLDINDTEGKQSSSTPSLFHNLVPDYSDSDNSDD